MSPPKIDSTQFQQALTAANAQFALIQKKYPTLKGYLVLSLKGHQTPIDAPLQKMTQDIPDLLLKGEHRSRFIELLAAPVSENSPTSQNAARSEQLQQLTRALELNGLVQVEIRFQQLDYSLVWKLQTDELVDRQLTPQTKASIRIVVGTLSSFSRV